VVVFAGRTGSGSAVFQLEYSRSSGSAGQLRATVSRRNGSSSTAWTPISSGFRTLEISWQAASSGTFTLWIDGVATSLTRLDTSTYRMESVVLGPSGGLANGMSGSLAFDRFVSSRSTRLGL
jgi:hypothetical protein